MAHCIFGPFVHTVCVSAAPPSYAPGHTLTTLLLSTLTNPDFPAFSPESSEIIIEILTISLAAAAALSLPRDTHRIESSLTKLLTTPAISIARRHHLTVCTLRGLLPLITLKIDSPNANIGRLLAHHAASSSLETLTSSLASFNFSANAALDA